MVGWKTLPEDILGIFIVILLHGVKILLGSGPNGAHVGQDHVLTKRGTKRIFGGYEGGPHEFPMIARIDVNGHRRCSGTTVLNHNWILTAAYCIVWPHGHGHWPLENVTVYVGDHNISVVEKGEPKLRIVESLVHERFIYNSTIKSNRLR